MGTHVATPTRVPCYPEHLRTFDYIGRYRYFLTFCTANRRHCFTDRSAVDVVTRQFLRAADGYGFAVAAYCFMPAHVHLLVEGEREGSDCKRFIKAATQYSGFAYSRARRERLWQRYGFERVLRHEEATSEVIRYIVANPLRAGLARSPEDYPFWGSFRHTREELLEFIAGPPEGGPYDFS